jgi:hypothetical protein
MSAPFSGRGIPMQALGFLGQALLLYVLLLAGTAVAVWLGPGFHTVNGQLAMLFVLVAGVPGVLKIARGRN